jgi:formiminotetrahydrofolate cyclodeaminase
LTKEDLRASNELNQLTDENSRWFLSQIEAYPKDSEERKFFESMTDAEKLQNIKNMNKVLNATL